MRLINRPSSQSSNLQTHPVRLCKHRIRPSSCFQPVRGSVCGCSRLNGKDSVTANISRQQWCLLGKVFHYHFHIESRPMPWDWLPAFKQALRTTHENTPLAERFPGLTDKKTNRFWAVCVNTFWTSWRATKTKDGMNINQLRCNQQLRGCTQTSPSSYWLLMFTWGDDAWDKMELSSCTWGLSPTDTK